MRYDGTLDEFSLCKRCAELKLIIETKTDRKMRNIEGFRKFWTKKRIRIITEDYFTNICGP